jgi:hypothetical protein
MLVRQTNLRIGEMRNIEVAVKKGKVPRVRRKFTPWVKDGKPVDASEQEALSWFEDASGPMPIGRIFAYLAEHLHRVHLRGLAPSICPRLKAWLKGERVPRKHKRMLAWLRNTSARGRLLCRCPHPPYAKTPLGSPTWFAGEGGYALYRPPDPPEDWPKHRSHPVLIKKIEENRLRVKKHYDLEQSRKKKVVPTNRNPTEEDLAIVKKQAHDFAFFNPGIEEDDLVSRGYLTLVAEREEHDKGLKRLNYDRLTRYCFEETRALKSRMPLPNAETEERPADSRSGQIFGNHGTAYRPTPDDYDTYSLA